MSSRIIRPDPKPSDGSDRSDESDFHSLFLFHFSLFHAAPLKHDLLMTAKRKPRKVMPTRAQCSQGGKRQTDAQRRARAAMQAARKGVPVHPLPALVQIRALVVDHGWRVASGAELARLRGVNSKSVSRWLRGILRPDPRHHVAIRGYALRCKGRAERR